MISRRSIKRAMLFVAATTLSLIVVAETLLRVHNPIQSRVRGDRIVLVSSKTFSFRNTTIPRLPSAIVVHLNTLGFRGPDPPNPFSDYLSIVAIGGSTTQCFFLPEGLTWSDQLARRLNRTFTRVWVNNAGLDGHSTFGHLVLVRDYVAPLRPKVALFLIGLNDVDRRDLSAFDHESIRSGLTAASVSAFAKSLAPYSEVASTLINLVRSYEAYQRGLLHRPTDVRTFSLVSVDEAALERYLGTLTNALLVGYEARVNALIDQSRAAGIEPVLITQPLLLGAGVDDVTGVDLARVGNGSHSGAMYWGAVELYNGVVRRVGRDRGALVIDLAHQLPKSSTLFYDFTHFTAAGADAVATIIYASLCPALQVRFGTHVYGQCLEKPG